MDKPNKIIVGIDPDTVRSGICIYRDHELSAEALPFPQLLEKLYLLATLPGDVLVVVEAGWLNDKSNFHGKHGSSAERIAKNVGSNHQTGRHIVEMAKYFGLEVIEQKPFLKGWKGAGGKITHDELNYILENNGIELLKSSNQDVRDAILITIIHANLKIKIRV
jgi:hypothetical protein